MKGLWIKTAIATVSALSAVCLFLPAEAQVCKHESFDTTGSDMAYGLENVRGNRNPTCAYPDVAWQSGGQWCVEHDPNGGDDGAGDGAAHIIFQAGQNQFNAGWYWGHECQNWADGDTIRIKFKIRFDSNYQWNQSHNNKFMIWGTGGYRMILFIRDEYWTSANCRTYGPGSYHRCTNDGSNCDSDADCIENNVQYMCVEEGSYTNRGGFAVGHGIGNPCAGPAEVAQGEGLGNDQWFYVQVEVRSGSAGYEKIWINNNNEEEPNACTGSSTECGGSVEFDYSHGRSAPTDIRTEGWANEQTVGDFWTDAVDRDMGYYIDDMTWERNGSFDASFYGGGGPGCSDGRDNDRDGLTDYPADPGCTGAEDPGENNCGNGIIDGTEVCDGTLMGGATCSSQGFESGVLGCAGGCLSYDTSFCASPSGGGSTMSSFSSDFETGDFSEWNGRREQSPGDLQVVEDPACNGGSWCARARLTAGTNSDNYAEHTFGDYHSVGEAKVEEVWLETSVKFEPGYVWPNSGQKIAILNVTDGISSQRRYQVILKVESGGFWSLQHSDIDDWRFYEKRQNVGTPAPAGGGGWTRLKVQARMNTPGVADGVLRLWVDGALKAEYADVNLRESTTYGFGKLLLSSWASDSSVSDGILWYDDWVLTAVDPAGEAEPPTAPPGTVTGVTRTDQVPQDGD